MKKFTFDVCEYTLVGVLSYPKIIEAKDIKAAHKKMDRLRGNRDMSWTERKGTPIPLSPEVERIINGGGK